MTEPLAILITCEHGGNQVPEEYRGLFLGREKLLQTHRGYDIGILAFAKRLGEAFDAHLVTSEVTRLLIDLNRSLHHRKVFSEISRSLAKNERQRVIEKYYHPYRRQVGDFVAETTTLGRRVLHLSVHSFTPDLRGEVRKADIGLLYDPKRPPEVAFCRRLKETLRDADPALRVRRNYPYRGSDDGLQTALRCQFAPDLYLGMELEINQGFPLEAAPRWQNLQADLEAAFGTVIAEFGQKP